MGVVSRILPLTILLVRLVFGIVLTILMCMFKKKKRVKNWSGCKSKVRDLIRGLEKCLTVRDIWRVKFSKRRLRGDLIIMYK